MHDQPMPDRITDGPEFEAEAPPEPDGDLQSDVERQSAIDRTLPAIKPAEPVTPMSMLAVAVQQGHDLEKIEKLMELERRWKADQARESYYKALTKFKKVPVVVTKDRVNSQYKSRYTSIGNFVATVNAALAPCGLSARWSMEQDDKITVTCILSHTLGHSESVSLSGLPDESGKKNPLQQIKSTITYLELATLQAVTGVVAQDANLDDDGNASGDTVTEDQAANIQALIEETGADKAAFLKYANADSIDTISADVYHTCVAALERKRKQ